MITGSRQKFEQRCRHRGYSLEDARACVVSEDGDTITVDETHPAYPRARSGLGDMIAAGLSSVGITKERVQKVAKAVGIKDCGCGKRHRMANLLGEKYLGLPPGSTASDQDAT